MDIYAECMVRKRPTNVDTIKKVGLIAAVIVIIILALTIGNMILGAFSTMLAAGAIFGAYWLISNMYVEYEYILTNGEIDIDKIVARKKRKRLATLQVKSFDDFGLYHPGEFEGRDFDSRILACISEDSEGLYYAVLNHSALGECLLVFNPNQRIVDGIKAFLPRTVIPKC